MPLRHHLDLDQIDAHPQWQMIGDADRDAILQLVADGKSITAIKRIQSLTDCGLADAHTAFHDVSRGIEFKAPTSSTLCPQCSEPLRTDVARQCLSCGADLH